MLNRKPNANFIVFDLTWPGFKPTIYHTQGNHTNWLDLGSTTLKAITLTDMSWDLPHSRQSHQLTWPGIYHTQGNHTNWHDLGSTTLKAITLIITITPQIQLYHSLRLRYWVCLYWLNRDERIHNLFFILQLILII
jgi:hypothetical protein